MPEAERGDAANSLVYEANLRLRDPVYGCMGAISVLQQQVSALEAELEAVRAEIFKHRYRQASSLMAGGDDAGFMQAPAMAMPPVHAADDDVVSVAAAAGQGQDVIVAGIPGTPPTVYAATGQQPSSSTAADDYGSLNTSEHGAYFG